MYDLIKNLIDHVWSTTTSNSSEQQVIYYICGAAILLFSTVFIDLLYRITRGIFKKGDN